MSSFVFQTVLDLFCHRFFHPYPRFRRASIAKKKIRFEVTVRGHISIWRFTFRKGFLLWNSFCLNCICCFSFLSQVLFLPRAPVQKSGAISYQIKNRFVFSLHFPLNWLFGAFRLFCCNHPEVCVGRFPRMSWYSFSLLSWFSLSPTVKCRRNPSHLNLSIGPNTASRLHFRDGCWQQLFCICCLHYPRSQCVVYKPLGYWRERPAGTQEWYWIQANTNSLRFSTVVDHP